MRDKDESFDPIAAISAIIEGRLNPLYTYSLRAEPSQQLGGRLAYVIEIYGIESERREAGLGVAWEGHYHEMDEGVAWSINHMLDRLLNERKAGKHERPKIEKREEINRRPRLYESLAYRGFKIVDTRIPENATSYPYSIMYQGENVTRNEKASNWSFENEYQTLVACIDAINKYWGRGEH